MFCPNCGVNGGGIMYRRGGVKVYHGLRRQLVPVVHGRGLWAHGVKRGYSDGRWRRDRLCLRR